jgi:fumarylpyruvate hydrolase
MQPAFEPQPPVIVPVDTGEGFPVRRVFCIGRNYAAHAREMGSDPSREPPFFFTKWAETVVPPSSSPAPSAIAYPPQTENYHFEAELVVAIGRGGHNIEPREAAAHIFGYACGLDMTRRDLQNAAKEKGRPWDTGKNVEQSAPIGLIHATNVLMVAGAITLKQNGEIRQSGKLSDMIWSVADVIAYVSRFYRLEPGDLIYTGTPEGVGPVAPGDHLKVSIAGLSDLDIMIAPPSP